MTGNKTIAPRAWAEPVARPEIEEVRSRRSGIVLKVERLIRMFRYERAVLLRQHLKLQAGTDKARFTCAICGVPVYLACSTLKRFFFRHRHEDGSCPAVTRSGFTEAEIRAMKYRGAQESTRHIRTKELLMRSLSADERFHDVKCEQTWRASEGLAGLRRPDVSAAMGDLRIAFEVQLSTTFLDVVLQRREFYREQRAALLWVVPMFHPSYRRMTDDDILFGNNSNIFVVDEISTLASEKSRRLTFTCWYREPRIEGGEIVDDWVTRQVEWDALAINLPKMTICAFDYDARQRLLSQQLRQEAIARQRAAEQAEQQLRVIREQNFRDRAFHLVDLYDTDGNYGSVEQQWIDLNDELKRQGWGLIGQYADFTKLTRMVHVIETARRGRPIGFGHRNLAEVAHHLFDQHPDYLLAFGHLLKAFDTMEILYRDDRTGKWRMKVRRERAALREEPRFRMQPDEEAMLAFLSQGRSRAKVAMDNDSTGQIAA